MIYSGTFSNLPLYFMIGKMANMATFKKYCRVGLWSCRLYWHLIEHMRIKLQKTPA